MSDTVTNSVKHHDICLILEGLCRWMEATWPAKTRVARREDLLQVQRVRQLHLTLL